MKIVLEETGTYHLPVLGYLLDKEYFVTAEKIKKYLDRGLRKAKTDKDDNTFILGLEIFKKYYHPEIVKKKKENQFITEVDKTAKKLNSCADALIITIKTSNTIITEYFN